MGVFIVGPKIILHNFGLFVMRIQEHSKLNRNGEL